MRLEEDEPEPTPVPEHAVETTPVIQPVELVAEDAPLTEAGKVLVEAEAKATTLVEAAS